MQADKTALILIGYQYDYFNHDGILSSVIEESALSTGVLKNSIDLIEKLSSTAVDMISTPIIFTPDYSEIQNPSGILQVIKDAKAFQQGSVGSEVIPEILRFGKRIKEHPGKRGLNAFSNTDVHQYLQENNITDIILAGVVTSLCIDSTARAAYEYGYNITILSDCTSGRSDVEQEFYCNNIFPLYSKVIDHNQLIKNLKAS